MMRGGLGIDIRSKSVFVTFSHWGQWNKFIRRYAIKVIDTLIKEDDNDIRSMIF